MSRAASVKFSQPHLPQLFTAKDSISIQLKHKDNEGSSTTIKDFVDENVPSLRSIYKPAWWLFNGHLQTAFSVFGDFSNVDRVVYDRKFIRLMDGGTLGLDFTPPQEKCSVPDDMPIIVVTHGLTGGSYESYLRSILAPAVRPKEAGGLGWRAVVVNFRGCAGVPLTSPQLYSACHTDDLRQALIYIGKKFPDAPLYGIGFSLGGSVLVNYLGEEGENSRLRAGCALGAPWDIPKDSDSIESTWLSRRFYSKTMGANFQKLASRHMKFMEKYTDTPYYEAFVSALDLRAPRLYEVDDTLFRVVGGSSPPFPFETGRKYYEWSSCIQRLPDVRVPLLGINAADDPVVTHSPLDAGQNGWVAIVLTQGGGHLGWFERDAENGFLASRRWIHKPVLEWFKAVDQELEVQIKPPVLQEVDCWVRQMGREDIGIKEIEGMTEHGEGKVGNGILMQGL